jgi:hypothetical protein
MTPYILWDRDRRAEFRSLQELEQLIEQLTMQAEQDATPLGIQIKLNPETGLLITVGREESHVEFYSTTARPLVVACRGPWDSDELIEANFMGEPSTIEKRYCVPIADAREAVRRCYLTSTRPDNITWGAMKRR